ncbi:peptidoglycan-binding protein [Cytobacillus firmus]
MAYAFEKLPQLVDKRGKLPRSGSYSRRTKKITDRVWHHSLTLSHLGGSDAESFADYHVSLGWPGVGYHFVIEPKNKVNTPKGKRARIVYANDINLRTYHVGDSNQFSLGICVAGDYRTEKLDDATKATIDELQEALVRDGIGQRDKSHQEMPGYSWKACCVFDYQKVFAFLNGEIISNTSPKTYVIQEGDTFWGLANNIDGITVNDLIVANPGVDPKKLKVGQKIKLGKAKNAYTPKKDEPKKAQETYKYPLPSGVLRDGNKGESVKKLQRALNAIYFKCGTADGIFGAKTKDALRRFQMVYLPYEVDGVYGPNTKKKLQAVLKSKGF